MKGTVIDMQIPRCMSTQHPDNVHTPFFSSGEIIFGEDEVKEAYYAFSHLGCTEQMWDCEGKEVDTYVVKKLLTGYESFFRTNKLGEDVFITLRVPNPTVEKAEAKILLETLESIPRSYDAAQLFYGRDIAPIFEVILPMTTSHLCLDRIYKYYKDYIVERQYNSLRPGDISLQDWIGEFLPRSINVIPLFEDLEHMVNADRIVMDYLEDKTPAYQRVFLARSDLAMNYGFAAAVLINKIALQRFEQVAAIKGIPLLPMVGVGSAPFRGNLKPSTARRLMAEYPSVQTFTIQSSFKYDNPVDEVREGVRQLNEGVVKPAMQVDEERCLEIVQRYAAEYNRQVVELAPIINAAAKYVPKRRARKLHIGLFGYARSMEGVSLPRAISFTCALYSIGLPPEVLGLSALSTDDYRFIKEVFVNADADFADALSCLDIDAEILPASIRKKLDKLGIAYETDQEHLQMTRDVHASLKAARTERIGEVMLLAANRRGFLG